MSRRKDDDILVIIVENDIDDPLRSYGAIIWEQYPRIHPEEVMEKAKQLADGGKYGRVWVGKVEDITLIPPAVMVPDEDDNPNARPLEGTEA